MARRTWTAIALAAALLAAVVPSSASARRTAPAPLGAQLAAARGTVGIVVVRAPGSGARAERAVRALGGTVTRDLALIHGFAATIRAEKLAALAANGAVAGLSLDSKMTVQSTNDPTTLPSVFAKTMRVDDVRQDGNAGMGVTVALVDTGIADLPDVSHSVVTVQTDPLGGTARCVNFSGEPNCNDSYGHGTFLAGLIAGNGGASDGEYAGVAPDARLVSLKVAGRDGSADVSHVIAAIQWAVSFRNTYGIRILNLSLGTDSTQSYRVDPLNYAVEKAWAAGIVVVVSASNRGPAAGTISKPGDDPFVVTVGATDDRGTSGIGDDRLPNFSSHGPTAADGLAKPDLVAPGAHLVSLNAPGSALAQNIPTAMPAPYRRGSGTSMSTALVSGAVALMLSAQPSLTPDRVKFALAATARPAATSDVMAVGAGSVDVEAALNAPPGLANQGLERSTGLGSIEYSRGTVRVQVNDPLHTVVGGMMTAQLLVWDASAVLTADWTGSNWYGSNWYGSNWYGSNWYGSNWYGSNWYGSNWYGQMDGSNWYGSNWYGSNWYGAWE